MYLVICLTQSLAKIVILPKQKTNVSQVVGLNTLSYIKKKAQTPRHWSTFVVKVCFRESEL
ncbi:hypothetical protein BZG13_08910 [Salinivibrio sp. ML323]|nr:hypothetical protein BZG13_08910 [Salinivibrio sp. ML323]